MYSNHFRSSSHIWIIINLEKKSIYHQGTAAMLKGYVLTFSTFLKVRDPFVQTLCIEKD